MSQKKKVKLEDIAKEMGVSIVTVSNALNGRKGVGEDLREEIKQVAKQLGYLGIDREAKKHQPSYIIGVLVAERYVKEFPSFYMDIYKLIAHEVAKKGHLTVLEVVTYQKENLQIQFEPFLEKKLAGLMVIGELKREYIEIIRKHYKVPIVCVDYYDVYEDIDYIITDGFGGMEQMTELLLEQGYRNLAFVGTPTATKNIMDRYQGYCKALEKVGEKVSQKNIINDRDFLNGDYRIDFELPEILPEAFVCNCDKTASLLLEKLEERGVQVPKDVSVVSFDNYYSQKNEDIKLTTYENDQKVIVKISLNTLLKRISNKKKRPSVRIIGGSIVKGNTVKLGGDK